ncbi:hypothetical protein A9K65_033355 (plasmid) [Mesorhizobium sp. WSM1497]|nr:hypothetical protein A9K65_033355 [Mesorhizobium sp. WSM1497]
MEAGHEAGSVARGPENAEVSGLLSRWNGGDLSMMEAGELLGMSERKFRRYRERYEEAGEAGLLDRRLGKLSTRRVPAEAIEEMLELYRHRYLGWNVKHFHEHLLRDHDFSWGYPFIKTQLHAAGLVGRARRRGAHRRKEAVRGEPLQIRRTSRSSRTLHETDLRAFGTCVVSRPSTHPAL